MNDKNKASHGPGKGRKAIATSVPEPVYAAITKLASASDLTVGGWARQALIRSAEQKFEFRLQTISPLYDLPMAAESEAQFKAKKP
jgi:hypothetical protein